MLGGASIAVIGTAAGLVAFTGLTYAYLTSWSNAGWLEPVEPVSKVAIVMCAFNEENWMDKTMESLENQNIVQQYPQLFEFILVDNESTDGTAKIAKSRGWTVVSAKRGKLYARDAGIRATDADIIVSVDADSYYPPNCLNLLLEPFKDPQVVGATGSCVYVGDKLGWRGTIAAPWLMLTEHYRYKMLKGNISAIRRDAYFASGGFDLTINQHDSNALWKEEEWDYPKRLTQVGKIAHVFRASIYTSDRRFFCSEAGTLRRQCEQGRCPLAPRNWQYCQEQMDKQRF